MKDDLLKHNLDSLKSKVTEDSSDEFSINLPDCYSDFSFSHTGSTIELTAAKSGYPLVFSTLTSDKAIELGYWLLSRDYSSINYEELAEATKNKLIANMDCIPKPLHNIVGYSSEVLPELIDTIYMDKYRVRLKARPDIDYNRVENIMLESLESLGITPITTSSHYPDTSELVQELRFVVANIITHASRPNKSHHKKSTRGVLATRRAEQCKKVFEVLKDDTVASKLWCSVLYCVNYPDKYGDINYPDFLGLLNAFYLLNKELSDSDKFLLISGLQQHITSIISSPISTDMIKRFDRFMKTKTIIPSDFYGENNILDCCDLLLEVLAKTILHNPDWGNRKSTLNFTLWNTKLVDLLINDL